MTDEEAEEREKEKKKKQSPKIDFCSHGNHQNQAERKDKKEGGRMDQSDRKRTFLF